MITFLNLFIYDFSIDLPKLEYSKFPQVLLNPPRNRPYSILEFFFGFLLSKYGKLHLF